MPRMRCRSGLCPGPRWGSSRRSPRPCSRLGRRTPPTQEPHPLGASILARSLIYPSYGPWKSLKKSLNLILTNGQEPWLQHIGAHSPTCCWLLSDVFVHSFIHCLVLFSAQQRLENGIQVDRCVTIRTRNVKKVYLSVFWQKLYQNTFIYLTLAYFQDRMGS